MTGILETERLRLRPFRPDDVEPLLAVVGDAVTMRWYPAPFTREQVEAWIVRSRALWDEHRCGLWAIELRDTGAMVGDCGPVPRQVDGVEELELGWHVHRDHWGEGIAPEAAAACRDLCLERGSTRLISLIRPENTQSRRVAEKIGMAVDFETTWADLPHLVYSLGTPRPTTVPRPTE